MVEHLSTITELAIADIEIGARLRPVGEAQVAALIMLIEQNGFTQHVVVRRTRSGFTLLDGAHRLEAMTRLERDTIAVHTVRCTDVEARALEAGQNLGGNSMTVLDDALFMAAYSAAYEEMYPETKQGTAGALAKHGLQANLSSFAEMMAEKRGVTPRQIQKVAAAGRAITLAEAAVLRSGSVSLKDMQAIGKCTDPTMRSEVCAALGEGRTKSAASFLKARRAAPGAAVVNPVETDLKRLRDAWVRASKEARRRFVGEEHVALFDLLRDLDGGLAE